MVITALLNPNLLATKFHLPSSATHGVPRSRLAAKLDEGLALQRKVTLVSAPAGFGKTTCVSEWARQLDGRRAAWLSLDAADDDAARFFSYFIAALQQAGLNIGQAIEGVLRAGQLPPPEVISTTLVNDILSAGSGGESAEEWGFLLILDDFHVIQNAVILRVLEGLIDNLPAQLHLVLITREDPPLPLARLRASNRLTEIRAGDLRFDAAEAHCFLSERLELSLSQTDVALLQEKTEGWVVGLQLAALALQGVIAKQEAQPLPGVPAGGEHANPSSFIASLSGSHRFILDYLTEQVVERQPPEIRRFLLQTSVLAWLNGDLCNAVSGRSDSHSLLAQLFKANLFLVSLDDEGHWYRYHHLFADLLRTINRTLAEEERRDLHRRASEWYAAAGMVGEAMRHALAAGEYARAVGLLEKHASRMIMQGYAQTVHGWLQAIPAAWLLQGTRTELAFAWMHLLRGAYGEARPYLERVETALAGDDKREKTDALRAEWLVMRSLLLQMEGNAPEGERLAREALAMAPQQDAHARSLASFALASALRLREETAQALDVYRSAIYFSREAANAVAEMLSTVGMAGLAFEQGQLRLAADIAGPVIARLEELGSLPPISSVLYGVLGDVHYQWQQLDEARRYGERALQLSTLGGYKSGRIGCLALLARLSQMERKLEQAASELGQARDLLSGPAPDYIRQELVAQQVRLFVARGLPEAARLALQGEGVAGDVALSGFMPSGRVSYEAGLLANSSLRLLLYQARVEGDMESLRRGIELADELLAAGATAHTLIITLEALLLRAQLRAMPGGGGEEGAARDYARALELGQREGILAVFVEQGPPVARALAKLRAQERLPDVQAAYVARIISLAQMQPEPPGTAAGGQGELVESLSERELEVLQLMVQGLKYREIASELFISLNTVRFHVKAIYGKLGVNKRSQAIARARKMHLL